MKIDFARGKWSAEEFEQITSSHTDGRTPFLQEEDCVVNEQLKDPEKKKYAYISLLSRKWFDAPTELCTECAFESYGAPLIVLSDDVQTTPDGFPIYGKHFEIVAFEEGINVWLIGVSERPQKIGMARFPVAGNEKLTLRVRVLPGRFEIEMADNRLAVACEAIPARFRAGITACEGINRFYSFETR